MTNDWELHAGDGPLIAAALHAGHELTPAFAEIIALTDAERRREEDPHTDAWTGLAPTRVIARRSRFEVDLNRPREEAVYRNGEDAWGGELWTTELPDELIESSRRKHDHFYEMLERMLRYVERQYGAFVVYDLHSYNHRRGGPDAPPADPAGNPDVNLGTGSMDRDRWGHVADRFMRDLRGEPVGGEPLDVRENVRFKGRYLASFIHERFPTTGCALAIEVKKTFMDEHTGVVDAERHTEIYSALTATTPGVLFELQHQRVH